MFGEKCFLKFQQNRKKDIHKWMCVGVRAVFLSSLRFLCVILFWHFPTSLKNHQWKFSVSEQEKGRNFHSKKIVQVFCLVHEKNISIPENISFVKKRKKSRGKENSVEWNGNVWWFLWKHPRKPEKRVSLEISLQKFCKMKLVKF